MNEESITGDSVEVVAPPDVPSCLTLTLQISEETASEFSDYASGITSNQHVTVSGLSSCRWYVLRWKTVPVNNNSGQGGF